MTAHPPNPRKKITKLIPNITGKDCGVCVKNAHWWAIIFEKAKQKNRFLKKKKKKSTMPVLFPVNIYTLDSKPCSRKVENRYDKTWLEKWPEYAPIVLYTKQNTQGSNT